MIDRLQNEQNSAARVITKHKKFMKKLHWLPVNQRIAFVKYRDFVNW